MDTKEYDKISFGLIVGIIFCIIASIIGQNHFNKIQFLSIVLLNMGFVLIGLWSYHFNRKEESEL